MEELLTERFYKPQFKISYEVTYEGYNVTQEKYFVSDHDYETYIKPTKELMGELEKSNENKKENAARINGLKKLLDTIWPGDYFVESSPLGLAINTGVMSLPKDQGGDHKVGFKLLGVIADFETGGLEIK